MVRSAAPASREVGDETRNTRISWLNQVSTMRRRTGILIILIAVLFTAALAQSPGTTQEQQSPPTAAPPRPAGPQPVPTTDIARTAEADLEEVRNLKSLLEVDPRVTEIQDGLGPFLDELEAFRHQTTDDVLEEMSLRILERRRSSWTRFKDMFGTWQSKLQDRHERLETARTRLLELRDRWSLTRETVVADEAPEAFVERIDAVVREIDEAHGAARARLEQVLALEGRISERITAVDESLARISAAADEARKSIFLPDSSPLWRLFEAPGETVRLSQHVKETWQDHGRDLREFYERFKPRAVFQLALFIALVVLAIRLRRLGQQWKEEEDLSTALAILSRTGATALLITLLATRWIYPSRPDIVVEIVVLAVALPLLRLLPVLVVPKMRAPLYVLIGLMVLDRILDMTVAYPLFARFSLLIVTAFAVVGLSWMLTQRRFTETHAKDSWRKFLVFLIRLYLFILVASLVANVWGSVAFALLLAEGVVVSSYVAVAFYVGVLALDALTALLLRSEKVLTLRFISRHRDVIARRASRLFHLGAFIWWAWVTLQVFRINDPVSSAIITIWARRWAVGTLEITLGGILLFFFGLWVAVMISRFVCTVLEDDVFTRVELPRGVGGAVTMMVRYGLLTIGFLVAVAAAGIELSQFALIAGALGVGIGFGLRNVVNDVVSGLILVFERPIQIGDVVEIEVGGLRAEVRRIGIRSTTVRSFEGAEIVIPNGSLIEGQLINWTLSDRLRRIQVDVGVAYGTPPQQVLDILLATVSEHSDTLKWPKPWAIFVGFGESALNFSVRFWTSNFDNWMTVRSEVTVAVYDALGEAGITIPFPQRDLHVKSVVETVSDALKRGTE
jgi:small-conductance mechanosensitive channel